MNKKISIIIPFYNSEKTIKQCLKAIFKSTYKNFEVIAVSDDSKDSSLTIINKFNCKIIKLKKTRGAGYARNVGSKIAKGEYLLFIDSDVIIEKNTLSLLNKETSNKKIIAFQGVYSNKPNYKSYVTQYQQCFYIFYTWHKSIKYTSTLVTNCFAIKKKIFKKLGGFNQKIIGATSEDEEFGYKLLNKGHKIKILRKMQVTHQVNYTFFSFLKRSYNMYEKTIKSFLRNNLISKKTNQKNYKNVLLSIPLSFLIIFFLACYLIFKTKIFFLFCILFFLIHFILNFNFYRFIFMSKGFLNSFFAIFINIIDNILMGVATFFGSINFLIGRKY
tara:strand:+ start:1396 stop:2388 length:993 start_codon:yes stop_codon:yes gene_type:complete